MYIHQLFQKKIICWAIGYTRRKHNNRSNPDPFSYIIHRSRRPSHDKAIELARGLASGKSSQSQKKNEN